MKKEVEHEQEDEVRPEYDFSQLEGGVRGKYAERYRAGTNLVLLDLDVAQAFPTAKSVNEALRIVLQSHKMSTQYSLALEDIFNEYLKNSHAFEREEILKTSFTFWRKPKFPIEQVLLAGMKKESELSSQLRNLTSESDENKENFRKFIAELEAQDQILSYRANYLLGLSVLYGLLITLGVNFIELIVSTEYIIPLKVIYYIILFVLFAPAISEAWHRKRLSARIQSFLVIAKSVLEEG